MDDKASECPSKAFAALIFGYTTIISKLSLDTEKWLFRTDF